MGKNGGRESQRERKIEKIEERNDGFSSGFLLDRRGQGVKRQRKRKEREKET